VEALETLEELLLRLMEVPAPSGFEEPMMRLLKSELEPYVDEAHDTPRGNIIAVKRGKDPEAPKVALVAHMDQIGFIVFSVDDRGFARFRKLGGPVTRAMQGQQLKILAAKGPVVGVVGVKPGHITRPEEANQIPPMEEMYIDVGAGSRQEAEEMGVAAGTPIVYNAKPVRLANGLIVGPSIDDRAGVAALITIARELKERPILATVYLIGSVEEEIGHGGAIVALSGLDVDMAVAIDTLPAGWQPDVNTRDLHYEVGKGPAIHVGEIGDRTRIESQTVRRWLEETAKAHGIPHQVGVMRGNTDAPSLMETGEGVPSGVIGVPRRYSHSPVETVQVEDIANLIRILTTALRELDSDFSLARI
jgi:endoglucanase